ncbi:MAG: hypothetical protein KDB62_02705 [Solirubrobacterales bacterium]|nr:hypothetical protein [Solirubrobacterales bacterium]
MSARTDQETARTFGDRGMGFGRPTAKAWPSRWFHGSILVGLAWLAVLALHPPAAQAVAGCKQLRGGSEPPCNPHLAQSRWSASHRGSYAQGSSPNRGLRSGRVSTQHIDLPGTPIQIQFSQPYPHGGRVAWGSLVDAFDRRIVFKAGVNSGRLIDLYVPEEREQNPPPPGAGGITGAYNMLDRGGRFIVPRQRFFDVFEDAANDRVNSPIALRKRFFLPERAFCGPDDVLVGATMTYDGYVAFATERGVVGTVPRKPRQMTAANLRAIAINRDCDLPDEQLETVSNNIAADEKGGIYVVTSSRMRRFDHDSAKNRLSSRWQARYQAGSEVSEIRLGAGSGSTPSLMGTGKGQDRFVVITDGQDLMHLDLFWRDRPPNDWNGMGGGRPRRMACEYPVRFGDRNATSSLSEQSVAVRGYGNLLVNNELDYEFPDGLTETLRTAQAALRGGDPDSAPKGMERIDWDPEKRRCRSVWNNREVSVPNGIPSISGRSGTAYGIEQRAGEWGVGGLNWKSGKSRFFARSDQQQCSDEALGIFERTGILPILQPTLDELPGSCQNSFYAATEIGPARSIWTGTFYGMTIYRPDG